MKLGKIIYSIKILHKRGETLTSNIFLELSIILAITLLISSILRLLKQPLIIGYIIAGIIAGPSFLNILKQNNTLQIFSETGVAFLLFIVGLHLSPKIIKEVGKISLITGIGQIVFTSLISYFIAILLGFNSITSLYIAIALTFSSTIIIMKLLSDKGDLEKLYGKISIGFLLVQDLVAILILVIISSLSNSSSAANVIFLTLLKGLITLALISLITYFLFPRLGNFFANSQEFLFIFAIAWGLGLASLFSYIGLTIEVGSLIAGITLSVYPYSYEISSKLKPLRDFFIIFFFILLGSQMILAEITRQIIPAIIFSLFILIGNPLIIMILMGLLSYSKKTGFMAGLTVAQISEFALILIILGVKVGHLSKEIISFVTLIGLITIAGSTYLIIYSDYIYKYISKYLSIFERKNVKEKIVKNKKFDYLLFGYNRIGFSILNSFKKITNNYAVIDYNPETINKLTKLKINCVYGDVDDIEFLQELNLENVKLVVSTIPEIETNFLLLNKVREKNKNVIVIVTARQIQDAFLLYEKGADYVILPHFLGGEYIAKLIEKSKNNKLYYKNEKRKHIQHLRERRKIGHEHPKIETLHK